MRRIVVLTIATVAAACGGGPSRSDVIVDWTFEGGKNCFDAGLADIQFAIDNEVLDPNHFVCNSDGSPSGVGLGIFLIGDYQLTISGVDGAGVVTHQIVQTLHVRGAQRGRTCTDAGSNFDVCDIISIDVPKVADSTTAFVTWTFSAGDCTAANVQQVTIIVDPQTSDLQGGTNAGTVACSTMGTQGASVAPLTPGTHTFAIIGLRSTGSSFTPVFRTHTPVAAFFQLGLTTDVTVNAEPTP